MSHNDLVRQGSEIKSQKLIKLQQSNRKKSKTMKRIEDWTVKIASKWSTKRRVYEKRNGNPSAKARGRAIVNSDVFNKVPIKIKKISLTTWRKYLIKCDITIFIISLYKVVVLLFLFFTIIIFVSISFLHFFQLNDSLLNFQLIIFSWAIFVWFVSFF